MTGSSLFIVGGIISEASNGQLVIASSTVWTVASVFFTIGAIIHLFLGFGLIAIQSFHNLL
jgi:hypothetical protein